MSCRLASDQRHVFNSFNIQQLLRFMAMVLQHQTADELYSKQLQIRSEHDPVLDSVGHVI